LAAAVATLVTVCFRRSAARVEEQRRAEEEATARAKLVASLMRLQEKKNKRLHKKDVDKTQK